MDDSSTGRQHCGTRLHRFLDRTLTFTSSHVLSFLILLISVVALVAWEKHQPQRDAYPLTIRVLPEGNSPITLDEASAQLSKLRDVAYYDTELSESPFWFSFTVPPLPDGRASTVEFPSRHTHSMACWDAEARFELGAASRSSISGKMAPAKGGFALALDPDNTDAHIICHASFVGPARISASQWPASALRMNTEEFFRDSGLMDGGLVMLALFMTITAYINRERTYLLFAAWLIVSLRMAALSGGWDTQWLGRTIPAQWLYQGRLFTLALYFTLTISLFKTLFRTHLDKVGYASLLHYAQWTCVPLLVMSMTMSYQTFLPIYWTAASLLAAVLVFLLTRILVIAPSSTAIWYAASLGVSLLGSVFEIIGAALGYKVLIGSINSVTAALSSSLLAAIAIAEQIRATQQARLEAQATLEHTYEAMPIGLFTANTEGRFLSANPAMIGMLGAKLTDPSSNGWDQYFDEGSWLQLSQLVERQADGELEVGNKTDHASAEHKRFLVKARLSRGKIEGSLQDVTERSKAITDLRFMANNDPLTKVYNRRGIEKVIIKALAELPNQKPSSLALAYLDLDRFKLINELYGHVAGDEVLKQVCDRVQGALTCNQKVGRVGGDEFVIVFSETSLSEAAAICNEIIDQLSGTHYRIGDKAFQLRGTIGLVEIGPGTSFKDAISTADRACREAKRDSIAHLVVYEKTATVFSERAAELTMVERLAAGTALEYLFLDMQPIMSLKAPHASLNFEVLLRMRDRDGSLVSAGRIITAAEISGSTGDIDRWVLATTLAWIEENEARLTNTQFICVNLSGASLNDERFVQDAFVLLARNERISSRLCLEITESVALHDLDNTRRFIDKVRSCGVRIALDDFGAGYTSFSYLKEFPADLLKIDGNFIVDMNAHPANIAIVEAIVNLAKNLGMQTVAEWAEDNATVETLAEIGVDYVQGYVVARPQAPSTLLAATSSASFIKDEQLTRFVHTLSRATNARERSRAKGHPKPVES
ncbi:MAG TPA: EAL domain-containing protein [Noviherbaspirillum sp.]|jgi:diguanylate cyclase (GGDEF)-like protein|uniref:EAL domain-containing protein n=1 Tax=Noviherbaspirillum sp. TaxID=1926288 RepID=UPI002DDD47B2|nr:EAL domain-containing protein [Noviherbaspirillum sp.]HEV2610327.1 EAL domain-containing protein [Noviherbaspirillum sp.]